MVTGRGAGDRTWFTLIDSPVGGLLIAGTARGLTRIDFRGPDSPGPDPSWERSHTPFVEAARQLAEYFDGTRRRFELALAPAGTPFQLAVWKALQDIPYGETRTYADVARRIGRPVAVRAVGLANGRNPLPIVVPCHRVIGKDGSLTGYGGGLPIKRALLDLERGSLDFDPRG